MKGMFVFERSDNAADEFPLEVTEMCMGEPKTKGRVFFKGEETERREREEIDKMGHYELNGEEGKLSDYLYLPYAFVENGSSMTRQIPPCVMQAEYRGETVYLFANRDAFGTVGRESDEQRIPVHILPFSSEETEVEYCDRMENASEKEQAEILSWPCVFLMEGYDD